MNGIRRKYDPRTILFEPIDPAADVEVLRRIPGIRAITASNGTYEISLVEGHDPSNAMTGIVSSVRAARVALNRPTLEDVFIQIVTGAKGVVEEDVARLRASLRDELTVGVEP